MDALAPLVRAALQPFAEVSNLTDLYAAYKALPVDYILAGMCFWCATMAPEFKRFYLLHFWFTFFAGFGGGFVTSLLMMDPVKAPINILANNTLGITWSVCWWLAVYSPFDFVGRIHSFLPVRMVTKACVAFMRANLIITRVDQAVVMYPGVIAAPLILGTLAGCGGKLITDGIRGGWGRLPGPAEASVPGFVWRSAALAAAGYYGACKVTSLLTSQEAAALVITVLLLHSFVSDIVGGPVADFTYPIARVLHTLSLVPVPSAEPASAKPSKPSKAAKKVEASVEAALKPQQQTSAKQASAATAPNAAAPPATAIGKANIKANAQAIKADSSSKLGSKKAESKKSR